MPSGFEPGFSNHYASAPQITNNRNNNRNMEENGDKDEESGVWRRRTTGAVQQYRTNQPHSLNVEEEHDYLGCDNNIPYLLVCQQTHRSHHPE